MGDIVAQLETAGFEPASYNTPTQPLHAYLVRLISAADTGTRTVSCSHPSVISPLIAREYARLSSVVDALENPRGADSSSA